MKSFKMKTATPRKKPLIIIGVVYPPEVKRFNPPLRLFARKVWR